MVKDLTGTFGTPPHSLEEWLEIFIKDTKDWKRTTLNPLERIRLKGRIKGLEDALCLIEQQKNFSQFPITIAPKTSVTFDIKIESESE